MLRILAALLLLGSSAAAQTNPPAGGIRITLERTGCSMDLTCPAYRIIIEGDGTILFEGKHAVHAVGIRKSGIQPSAVRRLAQRLADKGYFDFPSSFGVCDDGAAVKTSLEMSGRIKKIDDGCGAGPAALRDLENEIDKVSGSKHWVRGRLRL